MHMIDTLALQHGKAASSSLNHLAMLRGHAIEPTAHCNGQNNALPAFN